MASKKNPQPNTAEPAAAGQPEVVSLPVDADTQAAAPVDASAAQPAAATVAASDQNVTPDAGADVQVAVELSQEPRYRISARSPRGFNRGGRFWHPDGDELTLSEIGGLGALEVLLAEPMLIVATVGGK